MGDVAGRPPTHADSTTSVRSHARRLSTLAGRNRSYRLGIISFTASQLKFSQQPCKDEQVIDTKQCPAVSDHNQGIGLDDAGPHRRHRADTVVVGTAEEDALLAPGMGVAQQLELLAAQRVVRMGNLKQSRIVLIACS